MAREWLLCGNYATKLPSCATMPASYDADSVNQRHERFIMPSLLQIHFNFPAEMMGPALTTAAMPLAESITREPGFHLQDLDREPAHRRGGRHLSVRG